MTLETERADPSGPYEPHTRDSLAADLRRIGLAAGTS